MKRFWLYLAALAWLFTGTAAPAQTLSGVRSIPLLQANTCSKVQGSLNFTVQAFCLKGQRYYSLLSIPGASYSGSVSGTGATVRTAVSSTGQLVSFANGVPRVTDLGILIEESRVNSFLNSAVGVTQSVTTTAAAWTLSAYGTGSITLSGCASGILTGTGAANRVTLTVAATACSTTLTVSGSETNVQFEAGAFATSYVPTAGAAVTRAADLARLDGLSIPAAAFTVAWEVLTAAGSDPINFQSVGSMSVGASAANRVFSFVDTDGVSVFQFASTTPGFGTTPVLKPAGVTIVKSAMAYDGANYVGAVNGTLIPSTAGTPVSGPYSRMDIGVNVSGVKALNGYVRRITAYPSVMSGTQLQALTQ